MLTIYDPPDFFSPLSEWRDWLRELEARAVDARVTELIAQARERIAKQPQIDAAFSA